MWLKTDVETILPRNVMYATMATFANSHFCIPCFGVLFYLKTFSNPNWWFVFVTSATQADIILWQKIFYFGHLLFCVKITVLSLLQVLQKSPKFRCFCWDAFQNQVVPYHKGFWVLSWIFFLFWCCRVFALLWAKLLMTILILLSI